VFQWQFDEAQMTVDNVGAPVTPAQWNYIHRQVIQHNDDIRCRRKMFNFFHTAYLIRILTQDLSLFHGKI
jgi:hypothetical protein